MLTDRIAPRYGVMLQRGNDEVLMQTYRLTFDLEGARWTEVRGARSRLVAIRMARAMLELLIAELTPKLALVAVNAHDDSGPCGGWEYARNRPQSLVWKPMEQAAPEAFAAAIAPPFRVEPGVAAEA